jgi:hypothetical protein
MWFLITTIEMEVGCAGTIDARVMADLKPSAMLATWIEVSNPSIEILGSNKWFKGSFQSFFSVAIQVSEQAMKEFVNDWAAAQKLALRAERQHLCALRF